MKNEQTITEKTLATLIFQIKWQSNQITHENIHLLHVNFYRDILPDSITKILMSRKAGDSVAITGASGSWVPKHDTQKIYRLPLTNFRSTIPPKQGRFYPQGFLKDIPGVFPSTIIPFRCIATTADFFIADLNHPFAHFESEIEINILDVHDLLDSRGGALQEVMSIILNGPGMEARTEVTPTDFLSDSKALAREDENDDAIFYQPPRLVTHMDDEAINKVTGIYRQLLKPGDVCLDLMSSYRSYLPPEIPLASVEGVGMNAEELKANNQLTSWRIHDLNKFPTLPYESESYDVVVCTASVEYLIKPFEIFQEVKRILKPNGVFALTFSNRYFPPKIIGVWKDLHEFERMGLVCEYFLQTGYRDVHTTSIRGWPRPEHDRYFPRIRTCDPVFAVWGYK